MPAPMSASSLASSNTTTRKPLRANARAVLKPPMPAPAMMTVLAEAMALRSLYSSRFGQGAFGRPSRVRIEHRVVTVERRAIRTDDLVVAAHVEKDMRVVERRLGAHAHEFARADFDLGQAGIIVEMGNDVVRHDLFPRVERQNTYLGVHFIE